jgi:hypothetical protein
MTDQKPDWADPEYCTTAAQALADAYEALCRQQLHVADGLDQGGTAGAKELRADAALMKREADTWHAAAQIIRSVAETLSRGVDSCGQ